MIPIIEHFEQMSASVGLDADDVDAIDLAEAVKRLALTDLRRAVDVSQRMVERAGVSLRTRVLWLAARAHVLCYSNQFEEATLLVAEARVMARREGLQCELAQVALASIQPLARLGRLEEAAEAADEAMAAFERVGDTVGRGKAALNGGIVLRMLGRLTDALEWFDAASAAVGDDVFLRGALLSNRAEVLLDLDRIIEAEVSFRSAHAAFEQAGNAHAAAIVEGNLGDLLSREGRIDEALGCFERAKLVFESSGAAADVARLDAEQAEALATLGATEEAVLVYARAIPALEAVGLRRELARSRLSLGLALTGLGAMRRAGEVLTVALGELELVKSHDLAAECRIALARLAILQGRVQEGTSLAQLGLEQLSERPVRRLRAHAELATSLLAADETDTAAEHVAAGATAPETSRLLPLRTRFSALRGQLLLRQGKTGPARAALVDAMRDADRLRSSLRAESFRLACGESWRQLYLDTCSCALEENESSGLAVAFESLERIRARTLLDAIGALHAPAEPADSRDAANHGLAGRYHACLAELSVLYDRAGLHAGRMGDSRGFERLEALESESAELHRRLVSLDGAGVAYCEPLTLDEALGSIDDQTGVVVLWPDRGLLSAMILRAGHASVLRRYAELSGVEGLLRRQRFCLDSLLAGRGESSLRQTWQDVCRELSTRVLHPLLNRLEGVERLAISTFGPVEELPWALLDDQDGLLGTQRVIWQVPGVSAAVRLPPQNWRDPASVRVLAVGVRDELAPRMQEEARAVALACPSARVLVGPDASASAVLAAVRQADVVHIASHCMYSDRHPMSSRIRCEDRWVTARELSRAVCPGASVVLAGCESGRSGGASQEDRQGLIRALLGGGASSVLASRWLLHDETSDQMMSQFHASMQVLRGDMAAALRDARSHMLQSGVPAWYHAGIFVTGGLR